MAWVPQYNREATERAALRSSYGNAAQQAGAQALGAARTLGRGNPLAAARAGANAAGAASARILGQQAAASTNLAMQQQARLAQEAEERRTRTERMMGGLLGGAGQLVGMLAPALGPAAPAASLASSGARMLGGAATRPGPAAQPGAPPGYALPPVRFGNGWAQPMLGAHTPESRADFDAWAQRQQQSQQTLGMVDQAMGGGPQMSEEEMRRRLLGGGM